MNLVKNFKCIAFRVQMKLASCPGGTRSALPSGLTPHPLLSYGATDYGVLLQPACVARDLEGGSEVNKFIEKVLGTLIY